MFRLVTMLNKVLYKKNDMAEYKLIGKATTQESYLFWTISWEFFCSSYNITIIIYFTVVKQVKAFLKSMVYKSTMSLEIYLSDLISSP